ncbi:hypothetical protein PoB_003831600, partial [Plakobranchus ocellatus]
VSEFTISGAQFIVPEPPLVLPLLDNDDRTCFDRNLSFILVRLKTPQPITFIRVVSNSASFTRLTLRYNYTITCKNPRLAMVDNRTVDITCPSSNNISELTLTGHIVSSMCSLYINGGKDVCLVVRRI